MKRIFQCLAIGGTCRLKGIAHHIVSVIAQRRISNDGVVSAIALNTGTVLIQPLFVACHEAGRYLAGGVRLIKESGANHSLRILCAGIPVMGHLGLTPQSIHKYGTYAVRAKEQAEADKLVRDAHLLEEAGCFGLVLEKIPAVLGTRVSQELEIPTIGIGAGGGTDGQVLVIHDMLGINNEFSPRFLRRYADLYTQMMTGVSRYVEDVKSGDFPSEQEQY